MQYIYKTWITVFHLAMSSLATMPFSLLQRAAGILCLALSITSCFSSPIAESVVLKPFHVANYEASFGLQPRDPAQLSILDLQSQGQLMYAGSPGIEAVPS